MAKQKINNEEAKNIPSEEALIKIEYSSPKQFLADLNKNFAYIQNSPFYKGIPGKEGDPGNTGLRGTRGSQFIFVDFERFSKVFKGELVAGSEIDLTFLNQKIGDFDTKQKLYEALNIQDLVNNDIIVLTNSIMISYDDVDNIFYDTKMAFNEQTNLVSSIEKKIEEYVKHYVDNNQTILNLKNIFESYDTYAKNYTDNNSTYITRTKNKSSVYVPYILGYNNTIGVKLENHKYFGFSDKEFPKENAGTIVLGSIKNYIDMLMQTTSTSKAQTLTSDYAPGENNIPAVVFMQDTPNNGIYFGLKNKTNMKTFASIYKDAEDNLIFKSDSSAIETEFSKLILNRKHLKYGKQVYFDDNLDVQKDFTLVGHMNNKFIRTVEFMSTYKKHTEQMELGLDSDGSKIWIMSKDLNYRNFVSNVFVTDKDGNLSKDYSLETTQIGKEQETSLTQITTIPNSDKKILTSNYLGFVIRKFNGLTKYCADNYWRKNQFETEEIPGLALAKNLIVRGETHLGPDENYYLQSTIASNNLQLGFLNGMTEIISKNITANQYKNNVLITNDAGLVSHDYGLELTKLSTVSGISQIPTFAGSDKKVLTANYLQWLIERINSLSKYATDNYWRKNQFETGDIPSLKLSKNLIFAGTLTSPNINTSGDATGDISLTGNKLLGTLSNFELLATTIKTDKFKSNVLVTDANGVWSKNYSLETLAIKNITDLNQIETIPNSATKIVTSNYLKWLVDCINSISGYTKKNYWLKSEYNNYKIPDLSLSGNLNARGDTVLGPSTNPFIRTNINTKTTESGQDGAGTKVQLKSELINLKDPSYKSKVLVTDEDGNIRKNVILNIDKETDGSVEVPKSTVDNEYTIPDNIRDRTQNTVLTGLQQNWLIKIINNIKKRLKDTYNKSQTIDALYKHLPEGSMIMWNYLYGEVPKGWIICNGQKIPGTELVTPNMIDKFIKVVGDKNSIGVNGSYKVTIGVNNLPSHNHKLTITDDGEHTHGSGDISIPDHKHNSPMRDKGFVLHVTAGSGDIMEDGFTPGGKGQGNRKTMNSDGNSGPRVARYTGSVAGGASGKINIPKAGDHNHKGSTIANTGDNEALTINPENYSVVVIMKYVDKTVYP